jgi:glycosyltransferase involved in cell wall biosynthesis
MLKSIEQLGNTWMNTSIVSVVIPAYNEEENIGDLLVRTNATLETIGVPYEIIVVDDGSDDETRLMAMKNKATVLSNGTNRGKGYALKKGIQNANGNILITMDADGSHRPEEIPKLLVPLLNGADVVFGSRFIGKAEQDSTKKLHIFGNKLFNLLIALLTGKRVMDSQTGFRAYKKKKIEEIEITSKGYEVETELTVKSLKNGYVIHEEPITFERRQNGSSHLSPLFDGIKIFKTIVKASINVRKKY